MSDLVYTSNGVVQHDFTTGSSKAVIKGDRDGWVRDLKVRDLRYDTMTGTTINCDDINVTDTVDTRYLTGVTTDITSLTLNVVPQFCTINPVNDLYLGPSNDYSQLGPTDPQVIVTKRIQDVFKSDYYLPGSLEWYLVGIYDSGSLDARNMTLVTYAGGDSIPVYSSLLTYEHIFKSGAIYRNEHHFNDYNPAAAAWAANVRVYIEGTSVQIYIRTAQIGRTYLRSLNAYGMDVPLTDCGAGADPTGTTTVAVYNTALFTVNPPNDAYHIGRLVCYKDYTYRFTVDGPGNILNNNLLITSFSGQVFKRPYDRKGGHATNYYTTGTTNYTGATVSVDVRDQIGCAQLNCNTGATAHVHVTFPIAFNDLPLVICQLDTGTTVLAGGSCVVYTTEISASQVTINIRNDSGTNIADGRVMWRATGKKT